MKKEISVRLLLLLVATLSARDRSFVETAPTPHPQQGSPEIVPEALDANVRELESLKQSIGKTLEMMKTQSAVYTDMNGHKESHSNSKSEVKEDGKLVASVGQQVDGQNDGQQTAMSGSVRTQLDVPAKGVHRTFVQPLTGNDQFTGNNFRRSGDYDSGAPSANTLEKYPYATPSAQYTPLDMAEYVFWTGDEKGVTLAIEEFLQEGIMSREEAISFLQDIKYNLDYLQSHYTQLGMKGTSDHTKQDKLSNIVKQQLAKNNMEMEQRPELGKFRAETKKDDFKKDDVAALKLGAFQGAPDEDYDELLERLRVADFLYTEYSLEEVIYQLAKVMFTQSLTRGSSEAQQALQKFTAFLETEAEQGRISRALEKKVLDVLIASLTDTLAEHPELSATGSESHAASSVQSSPNILRQILQMMPDDKAVAAASAVQQQQGPNRGMDLQTLRAANMKLKDKNLGAALSLGKYKTIR